METLLTERFTIGEIGDPLARVGVATRVYRLSGCRPFDSLVRVRTSQEAS